MNVRGMPGNTNHHWGLCDDVAYGPSSSPANYGPTRLRNRAMNATRQRYEWVPSSCSLAHFDRRSACQLLRGQQILVAGDSSAAQFFLSLTLQLGGPAALGAARGSNASAGRWRGEQGSAHIRVSLPPCSL